MRPFSDGLAWMIRLPRRIPQDIKFEIGRRAPVAFFKGLQSRLHYFACRCQRVPHILGVSARPKFGPDLKTRNFAMGADGTVIVATFNH